MPQGAVALAENRDVGHVGVVPLPNDSSYPLTPIGVIRMSSNKQTGFTLIELVMVIVIIGVLAAVAIPKFVDLRTEASTAAVQGVAGSLSSAAATNYAARVASNNTKGVAVADCQDVAKALQSYSAGAYTTALPQNAGGTYTITSAAIASAGTSASCTLVFTPTSGSAINATFTALGA
jgi:MSHA pilin protein MshA